MTKIILRGQNANLILTQTGRVGPQGPQGETGEGVPTGGVAGQVLTKQSNADYDTDWEAVPSAPVQSVNGQTGTVLLDTDDIPEGSANLYFTDQRAIDALSSELSGYVQKSGDTMTGTLEIDNPTAPTSLDIASNDSGGLNAFDSTGRVTLHSWQKAQLNNDDNTNEQQAHYGEVIRIDMEHKQAKGVIAFRENYLGAPEGPRTVAWLVAHGEANDSTPSNPLWHNHFSVELPDENGMLQTSFEFPFAPYNQAEGFGIPVNQMYNRSTTQLIAANRGLVAENAAGVSKNIYFSSGTRGLDANRRWGLQGDQTAEGGENAGTNFRINRYNDSGTFVDTVFFVRRSDKQVGINTTNPTSQFDVNGNIRTASMSIGNAAPQGGASLYIERPANSVGFIFRNTAAGGHTAANLVSQSQTSSSRAFQAGLQADSVNRFSIEASGLVEWGAGGSSGRDTNLYRSAANTLKTDDLFVANGMDASSQKIVNVSDATDTTDAVNLGQLNDAVGGIPLSDYVLKAGDTMTGTLTGATTGFGEIFQFMRDSNQVGRIDTNQVSGGGFRIQAQSGELQLRGLNNTGLRISGSLASFEMPVNFATNAASSTFVPTEDQHLTNKLYVDGLVNSRLSAAQRSAIDALTSGSSTADIVAALQAI